MLVQKQILNRNDELSYGSFLKRYVFSREMMFVQFHIWITIWKNKLNFRGHHQEKELHVKLFCEKNMALFTYGDLASQIVNILATGV